MYGSQKNDCLFKILIPLKRVARIANTTFFSPVFTKTILSVWNIVWPASALTFVCVIFAIFSTPETFSSAIAKTISAIFSETRTTKTNRETMQTNQARIVWIFRVHSCLNLIAENDNCWNGRIIRNS